MTEPTKVSVSRTSLRSTKYLYPYQTKTQHIAGHLFGAASNPILEHAYTMFTTDSCETREARLHLY